jgi:hypothetical protein
MYVLQVQHPKTLGYSLDKNLKPTVAYLWDDIGVRDDKIGRIVSTFPQVLRLLAVLVQKYKY